MVKPEDTFEMEASVGTSETDIKPYGAANAQVPTIKFARKIYGMLLNNQASSTNTLTIKIYDTDGTTLLRSIAITIGAYDTLDISRSIDSPILTVYAGQYLKAVASVASVTVVMNAYDL